MHYSRHVIKYVSLGKIIFVIYAKYKFYLNSRGCNILEDSRVSVAYIISSTEEISHMEGSSDFCCKDNLTLIFVRKKYEKNKIHFIT